MSGRNTIIALNFEVKVNQLKSGFVYT